jgi:PAS domain S-box-containing protein
MAAMRKRFNHLLREPKNNMVLVQLRERLLRIMLYASFVVGTILFVLAGITAREKGAQIALIIYGVLYIWTILITFYHRLPFNLRAIGWLGMLFAFGVINLVDSGFNVDSGLFLIVFVAMSILLMDLPAGIVALGLDAIAISIMGVINTNLNFKLSVGLPQSDPLLWIIGGIIFVLMGTLLIYSLTIVVAGLEDNLAKATKLARELEQTNVTLRMSEKRYRTLVETSPDVVIMIDLNGNNMMANQEGLAMFGYERPEDWAGSNVMESIAPDDRPRVEQAFKSILQTGEFKNLECVAVRKDGSTFDAEYNAALLRDEAGQPQAVIAVGRDITARKEAERILRKSKDALAVKVVETTVQLQQAASRLEELVKHGPTIVYSFRPSDRTITYISENVSAVLGYQATQFTEDRNFWSNHVHPEDNERVSAQTAPPDNLESSAFEFRFMKSDGTFCWLRGERMLLRDEQGNPMEYVGSLSDITDRKNTEETLRLSEARYRSLYEGMMDAYVSVEMDGKIVHFNEAYQKMVGYEIEELRGLNYNDLTPKKWHEYEAEITEKQVIGRGYSEVYEKEYLRKDGTVFPVELRAALIRDKSGNPAGMWALIRDISVRKIIEQTLRDSEARYRELLDNSMQGVIVFQDLRVVYTNQAVTESVGYNQSELNSLTTAELVQRVHPDDRHTFLERLQSNGEDSSTLERYPIRIIHKNGETRWIEARTVPVLLEERPAMMTTAIDVTEIKRVEAELQESERTQRSILNASDSMVYLADANGAIISANDKFVQRMGLKPDTVAGTVVHGILSEDMSRVRKVHYNRVVSTGKPAIFEDTRNGIWYENSLYPVQDESGKVVRVAVFIRDITEKRRMTEAVRASEEQYRRLAEAAHDMIYIINQEDCIEYVNSFGSQFLGQPAYKLVGQARARYFLGETGQQLEENIQKVFQTGEAVAGESANVFLGKTVWLNTWLVPLKNAAGETTSVLGVSRDITERKMSEEEIRQSRDLLEQRVEERTAALLESQDKMRLLTAQTVKAQEEERRIISRELHDDAGQALITLQYSLTAIQGELPETETFSRTRLADSLKVIDQTMRHIRSLSHSLRPPVLDIGGIDLSLQEYCREQSKRTQIPIIYQGQDIPGLPDEVSISLYRFVQEALTNVLKHAQATQVQVKLQYKKGEISLSVSDDGRGMEDASMSGGMGLLGIKERLKLLDGQLVTHSSKGRGTRLVASVPWPRPGTQAG